MTLHQRIAKKAYELYQRRLKENRAGDHLSDWYAAERIIADIYYRGR